MLAENRVSKIKQLLNKKTEPHSTPTHPLFWKPAKLIQRITANKNTQSWLNTQGSLTARLRQHCPTLEVVILSEKLEPPLANEALSLGLQPNEPAWIRCVLLRGGEENWVYARTVIPHFSESNPWTHLQNLGNKPLGEILFQNKSIQRTPFTFARQSLNTWPYLSNAINQAHPSVGYARRSVFTQQNASLLLTEVFLPSLLARDINHA